MPGLGFRPQKGTKGDKKGTKEECFFVPSLSPFVLQGCHFLFFEQDF
jgi:hypothetical protein